MSHPKLSATAVLTVFLLVMASTAASKESFEPPHYIKPNVDHGLFEAAAKGSLTDLRDVAAKAPYSQMREFAQAEIERSHWELKSSGNHAKACLDSSQSPELLTMALGCANAWMSSAVLQGDVVEQERRAAHVRRELYPLISKAWNGKDVRSWAFERQIPAGTSLPRFSVTQKGTKGSIDTYMRNGTSGDMYMTTILINNVVVQALVDTGTTRSILSKADALRVNASVLAGAKRWAGPTGDESSQFAMGAGVLSDVRWGNLKMSNYVVGIWDGPFSTVGLDLIGALPAPVHLSEKRISYGDKGMPARCDSSLALGGDLSGLRTHVYLTGSINGQPSAPIFLDTGASGAVNGYADSKIPVPDRLGTVKVLRGASHQSARSGPVDISLDVGSGSIHVSAVRFVDLASDEPEAIGSGVLNKHSIWLDLPRERGCVD